MKNGKIVSSITLESISALWLDHIRDDVKETTCCKYANLLKSYILPYIGQKTTSKIHDNDLELLVKRLRTTGGKNNTGLAPSTISEVLSVLSSLKKFTLKKGYISGYDTGNIRIKRDTSEIRILSRSEKKMLVDYICDHPDRTGVGILISLLMGLRIGELCALKWNDIDLDNGTLRVNRSLQRVQRRGAVSGPRTMIVISPPKSRSSIRTIPIPELLIESLRLFYTDNAYVLTGHSDKYIEPRTLENRFAAILRSCDIENVKFHCLRHTFATQCIELGFDIKSLSEILGHSNTSITMNRYVHPSMDHKSSNMNRFSAVFSLKISKQLHIN